MKKTFIYAITFIILGVVLGNYLEENPKAKALFKEKDVYYFLQEGVYSSKDIMNENIKDIKNKAIIHENDKYYVYVGISRDFEIAKKIKNIYEKDGYQIFIKEKTVDNKEFLNNLEQFDFLIKSSNTDDDILRVEEVVLSNYEEIKENNN